MVASHALNNSEPEGSSELSARDAQERLARLNRLRIRLLGDGVLRRTAWTVADELGWESTYAAEYVALTRLQADYLVTLDEDLARAVQGVVATAPFDALLVEPGPQEQ